jgi:ribonuclease-3
MDDWISLQNTLGVKFNDLSILQQAFVHRSYLNENPDLAMDSNERLEFLGDALLGFVAAEDLYQQFATLSEGEMTKLRAALVCQDNLAQLASSFQLGDYLFLGQGEEKSGGRQRARNLACAAESLIGAVLVDQGFFAARDFVLRLFDNNLWQAVEDRLTTDYKSRLQELAQAEKKEIPRYQLVETLGPDHDKDFSVEVLLGGEVVGRGCGKNKQSAEKEAARQALENLLQQ